MNQDSDRRDVDKLDVGCTLASFPGNFLLEKNWA